MRNGNKRFSCIKRAPVSARYFTWHKEVEDGCVNGCIDTKNTGTKVSKIAVVHQSEFGEKYLIVWLTKYSLSRHGRTNNKREQRGNGKKQPYPYFKAEKLGDLHQTDLVGPRYLRGTDKVIRFYTFHTIDIAGRTAWASQFTDKQSLSLCRHLLETWRNLGIPHASQMDNEMAATGGGRYPYSISQVIRLHLLLGIHVVFIPQGEPGRNATVESFNDLWQERVLRRHTCPTLARLKRVNKRFLRYYHYKNHTGDFLTKIMAHGFLECRETPCGSL